MLNYSPDEIGCENILLDIHKECLDEVLDSTTPKGKFPILKQC